MGQLIFRFDPIRRAALLTGLCVVLALLPGGPLRGEQSAVGYERQGRAALAEGEYRTALHNFRLAIEANPRYTAAHLGAARVYRALGEYARAREHYQRVLELDDASLEARTGLAIASLEQGLVDEAERLLREVRERDPGNVENNYAYGLLHLRRGSLRLAADYFERTLRLRPSHVPSLVRLAELAASRGNFDASRDFLERARRIDSSRPEILIARGRLELQLAFRAPDAASRAERLDAAYAAFRTADRLAPSSTEIQRQLAMIELYRNRPGEALARARELLAALPDSPGMHYLVGALALREGDRGEAAERIQQALRLDPGDSLVRFSLEELALADETRYPPRGALRRSLADARLERARFYESRRRVDMMAAHLRRSLALNPFDEEALRAELERVRRAGDYERFMDTLLRLRRIRPDDAGLRNRLEAALKDRRRYLAYRENLRAIDAEGVRATVRRTPRRIFVFDFQSEDAFPHYPDGPARFAAALDFELGQTGHVAPVAASTRARALENMRRSVANPAAFASGVTYRPEFLGNIEELMRGDSRPDFVVHGFYRRIEDGLEARFELLALGTGARLDRFRLEARGRDALLEIMTRAHRRLQSRIPPRGEVVRAENGEGVYINLGAVDGLENGQELRILRLGAERARCKIAERSAYVSRCELEGAVRPGGIDPGDEVRPAEG